MLRCNGQSPCNLVDEAPLAAIEWGHGALVNTCAGFSKLRLHVNGRLRSASAEPFLQTVCRPFLGTLVQQSEPGDQATINCRLVETPRGSAGLARRCDAGG